MVNEVARFIVSTPSIKALFERSCSNPGSCLHDISRDTGIPITSTDRMLNQLCVKGFLKKVSTGTGSKMIYYPIGLRDDEIELAFSYLRHETRRSIFLHVIESPGCRQEAIVNRFPEISKRQVIRLLSSLVTAKLLISRYESRAVIYDIGRIGNCIIDDDFENVPSFVVALHELLGEDVNINVCGHGKNVSINITIDQEEVVVRLGKWTIMNVDEDSIFDNKDIILGDGGEKVLVAIYNGCNIVDDIAIITTLPRKVIKAKINTLRVLHLVVVRDPVTLDTFDVTDFGKKFVEKLYNIKKN